MREQQNQRQWWLNSYKHTHTNCAPAFWIKMHEHEVQVHHKNSITSAYRGSGGVFESINAQIQPQERVHTLHMYKWILYGLRFRCSHTNISAASSVFVWMCVYGMIIVADLFVCFSILYNSYIYYKKFRSSICLSVVVVTFANVKILFLSFFQLHRL